MKRKLFIDYDGVIINTIKTIVNLYSEDFQYYKEFQKIDWSEIESWDFKELSLTNREYINTYFNSPRFFDRAEYMPWCKEMLIKLSNYYNIIIISMGCSPNLIGKEIWIKNNLPFCNFIGVNLKEYKDKSHIDMSNSIFIDDSYLNLTTSNADLRICGDKYEWNKDWQGIRCANWHDVWNLIKRED